MLRNREGVNKKSVIRSYHLFKSNAKERKTLLRFIIINCRQCLIFLIYFTIQAYLYAFLEEKNT